MMLDLALNPTAVAPKLHRGELGYRTDDEVFDETVEMYLAAQDDSEYRPAIDMHKHRQMSPMLTAWVLIRPFTALIALGLIVNSGKTWLLPLAFLCGIWTFQRSFTNAHNLVHGSYPLPSAVKRPAREVLMTVYGLMFGYASHLFKEAHFEHHRPANRCGVKGDPESICQLPMAVVVLFGPVLTARIFAYGFKNARSRFDRIMGSVELVGVLCVIALVVHSLVRYFHGVHLGAFERTFAFYGAEAMLLLWLFPLNAAWLPHQKCYGTMIGAARNTPGGSYPGFMATVVSKMLVGGTRWHLLHHSYMGVPSCNLEGLARDRKVKAWMRLQSIFDDHHSH
ncbi:MAG TPA: fatty acid desaturase [Planktothrix sp.]|jgi:fatty acid desaturase